MIEKPPPCVQCPAYKWGISFVPPTGPTDAKFAVIGQGPGEQEAAFGTPFFEQAPAGWRLSKWIRRSGLQRSGVWIGNVVQCWMPQRKDSRGRGYGNREPTHAEVTYCWKAHVGPAMRKLTGQPHLVPVGAASARWFLGIPKGKGVEKFMGTTQMVELPK